MINRSKQNWEPGSAVKVGFMSLTVVLSVASPGDFRADQYLCVDQKGRHYAFVPHSGCFKLEAAEVDQMRSGLHIQI